MATLLKLLALWFAILLLAVANGGLREAVLLKSFDRSSAFITSGLLLMTCVLLVAILSIKWLGPMTLARCAYAGLLWLALTLAFEFGFGLLRGQSMATLLDAYRFRDGNIWPLVLVVVALAPAVAALVRGTLVREGWR